MPTAKDLLLGFSMYDYGKVMGETFAYIDMTKKLTEAYHASSDEKTKVALEELIEYSFGKIPTK